MKKLLLITMFATIVFADWQMHSSDKATYMFNTSTGETYIVSKINDKVPLGFVPVQFWGKPLFDQKCKPTDFGTSTPAELSSMSSDSLKRCLK